MTPIAAVEDLLSVGVERSTASVELLAGVAGRFAADSDAIRRAVLPGAPAAILATCARSEIYGFFEAECRERFAAEVGADAEAHGAIAIRRGRAAVRHLFRVASGLESAILGEHEILEQVKAARRAAVGGGALLARLFESAIAAGRRVRDETGLGRLTTSYGEIAARLLGERLRAPRASRIGVAGGGALAVEVVRALVERGQRDLVVFTRHPEKTRVRLTSLLHDTPSARVSVESLGDLSNSLHGLDGLVTVVRRRDPLLTAEEAANARPDLVVVDFGMPPNLAGDPPPAASLVVVRLADLGESAPSRALVEAEAIVELEVERFVRWAERRAAAYKARRGDSPRAGVLLAAHGAGDGSAANRRVSALALEVARRLPDLRVVCGFVRGEPGFEAALARLGEQGVERTAVVPVMASAGHYASRLRQELERSARSETQGCLRFVRPLGESPALVRALVRDSVALLERAQAGRGDAVLVLGHGTERHGRSGASTLALGEALRHQLASVTSDAPRGVPVAVGFLDQYPRLEDVAAGLEAVRLWVVPFLLGGGPHVESDLRRRLQGVTAAELRLAAPLLWRQALLQATLQAVRAFARECA